ncbi:hypothetical protein IRJ41_001838 [Triplophysa rosa]|uniref:Uncharacterized protein n=1 Tax=Triplophysa rosa TaxID=992332 RepID=A0A9W7WYH7_TRIRA|nr:hypothetical protein IRJ41_001838 [Triplophysa rosa]
MRAAIAVVIRSSRVIDISALVRDPIHKKIRVVGSQHSGLAVELWNLKPVALVPKSWRSGSL